MAFPQGETVARAAAGRLRGPVATVALLAAIPLEERVDGSLCLVTADNSQWMFSLASTSVDAASQLVVVPTAGAGAWLRVDKYCNLKLAVGFATANAAVLFTVPVGFRIRPTRPLWEVTTGWTGGASSAIGLSSSNAAFSTQGDLLGGAAGDLAATLITASPGPFVGAAGTKIAGAAPVVLAAGDTVRFDRIVSAFTAGAGFAHLPVEILA